MSEIPYTLNTGKIKQYFNIVKTTGIPEKVTYNWLSSLGFRSKNDRRIVIIWKYIGFIDESGVPTDTWVNYRSSLTPQNVMARAILDGYNELFEIYPDAIRRDKEAIYAYFASKSRVSEKTVNYMVLTFQKLVELADFESYKEPVSIVSKKDEGAVRTKKIAEKTIHINLHLHLPDTNNIEIYESIFKSIKKYILKDEE